MRPDEKLARVYGFAGVKAADGTSQDLADALCQAMESPDARSSEACANALWWLADRGEEVSFSGSSDSLRRVGFLADELSQRAGAPKKLSEWSRLLWGQPHVDHSKELVLTDVVTPGRVRRLKATGTPVNSRWNVWGCATLRTEYL